MHITSHFTKSQDPRNGSQTRLIATLRDQVSAQLLMAVVSCLILGFCIGLIWKDTGSFWVRCFFFPHPPETLTLAEPGGLRQNSQPLISESTWQVTKDSALTWHLLRFSPQLRSDITFITIAHNHPHHWKVRTDTDCTCTCAVVINDSDRPPLEEVHQVQDGSAEGREVGVQADIIGIPVVGHLVLPLGLDVRHAQSVADGLDGIGRRAVWGAKNGRHAEGKLITCWLEQHKNQLMKPLEHTIPQTALCEKPRELFDGIKLS